MNATTLKYWLLRGEFEKLEHVVLEGRGARLLGEHSPDLRTRVFLKGLPNYLTKISHVHDAVSRGSLAEVQKLISEEPKKKLAIAKDPAGTPLLHKAVYHDRRDIVEWLVQNFPITVQQKDREGRIALHYCAACKDPDPIWDVLIENDSDASIIDKKGNPAAYYLEHSSEIELPGAENMSRRKTSFGKELLDFKPSNIRIWIHNRDIGKLQQVLWEGHGNKLRMETSNNPRVKRFLEAVPFIMGTIKDVHAATTNNDLERLRKKIEATSPIVLCAKDSNGLNVMHKAAGLGYTEIAREILARYPSIVETQDNEGKTPLHYAAAAKDDGTLYNLITEHGADESKLDHKQKAPAFYKNRPSDVDQSLLTVIPEAPRVAGTSYPKHWDWRILEAEDAISRGMKKVSSADIDSAFGSAESTTKNFSRSMEQIRNVEEDCDKEENAGEEENAENTEKVHEDAENTEDTGDGENAEPTEDTENKENAEENTEDTENVEAAEEDAENSEESKEPETTENKEEDEAEEGKAEDTEERSSDDDVVTGAAIPETEENPTPEDEAEGEKPEETEDEDKLKEEEEEEKEEEKEGEGEEEGEKEKEEPADAEDTSKQEEESKVEQEERNEPSTGDSGVDDPGNDEDQVIVGEHEELPEAELNEGSMTADPEIEKLVENGNMEQLASLVLNGEGRRLVGRHSKNQELQAFIDRVPSYMGKIHAVHMAAQEGNLRDLQSALDRRKFAVARDGSSPHGATPLHVAVIFGNTTIIRYLAGRFPETTHAIDLDGRTPLHYAATLADNGHYYNLLLHLGANPLVQDNFGEKAEYYKQNQSEFSHKSLLRDFGANEKLADEMLTDKDITEPETLATLERCFRLLIGVRHGMTPKSAGSSATLIGRCLKRPIFDRIKHRVTRMDHNLFDVIWPALKKYGNSTYASKPGSAYSVVSNVDEDESLSIVAPDYESYIVFADFFDPLIRDIHCVTASGDLPDHPSPRFFYNEDEDGEENPDVLDEVTMSAIEAYDLDPPAKYVQAAVIECCRNLENYTFPLTLTVNQLEQVEREIISELMSQDISGMMAEGSSEDEPGTYFTLNEILDQPSPIRAQLAASGLLLPITDFDVHDEKRLHGKHWPYGRGVYVASAGDLAAWVNVQDHLRVVCRTSDNRPGLIGRAYVRLAKVMVLLDERMKFKTEKKLGFLSARPHAIGNTLRFNVIIRFPELSKEFDHLKHLCVVRGLSIRETAKQDTVRVGNQQSLSITELQTLQDFSRAVLNVLALEKELSINSSMKIATLIAGIFRRRNSAKRFQN
ncbi:hypothetical protein K0M31_010733 [Melipona bicolor]|uniref:Arginine kinase n=1 Tax=Melipona bicolor TaxID=60889 RepID=A0AA40FKS5_9HYME|nr:hypothetical protein K0M31_010733 [Melipona bicolor]